MRVLFDAQDVLDLVNGDYVPIAVDVTEAHRNVQREMRKKDQNMLFYIHQCMNANVFGKIVDSTTAKAASGTLVRCYGGDASMKKVKLQSLRK